MSSPKAPCGACKYIRRKCTEECEFAPYFPPDQPEKFVIVHKAYGAAYISKLLKKLHPSQRHDAVHSLVYDAEARLADPIYGCVRPIWSLQQRLKEIQSKIQIARTELATYFGPQAIIPTIDMASPFIQQQYMGASSSSTMSQQYMGASSSSTMSQQWFNSEASGLGSGSGSGSMTATEFNQIGPSQPSLDLGPYQHQQLQPQQQQIQQQEFFRFNSGFETLGSGSSSGSVTATGSNEIGPSQPSFDVCLYQHQQLQHQQQPQQIQQQDFFRFNGGFEASISGSVSGSVTTTGVNQICPQTSLELGLYDDFFLIETHEHQLPVQIQLLSQPQQAQQGNELLQLEMQQEEQMTQQGTERDEERSVEPS